MCESCGFLQSAKTSWLVHVLVQLANLLRNQCLGFPNDVVEKFIAISNTLVNLSQVTKEDLVLSILDSFSTNFKLHMTIWLLILQCHKSKLLNYKPVNYSHVLARMFR